MSSTTRNVDDLESARLHFQSIESWRELLEWEPVRRLANQSPRKLRLLQVAACRMMSASLIPAMHAGINLAEAYADQRASEADLALAIQAIGYEPVEATVYNAVVGACLTRLNVRTLAQPVAGWRGRTWYDPFNSTLTVFGNVGAQLAGVEQWSGPMIEEDLCALVRDVFNPFFDSRRIRDSWLRWNEGTVRKLAETVYEAHDWGSLPMLADALEEAGAGEEIRELREHLLAEGRHTRGCWAIDALLGRERISGYSADG